MDDKTVVDPESLRRMGGALYAKFLQYENDRRLAELKWARNIRQFIGIYDPDVERNLDNLRSKAYPKLTRVKCISMLSRLMNLLFQDSDKCWGVTNSAVPNLEAETLDQILQAVQQKAVAEKREPTDDEIEQAIRVVAKQRAMRLETEIEDQLQELGGERMLDFVSLCRKVLMSGIQFGMGVLKGPFIETQTQRRWKKDATGRLVSEAYIAERPRFEFVAMWDYYPDLAAKTLAQMDGQFQRIVMSKHQVIMLKGRKDFFAAQIDTALDTYPAGNYKRRAYETDLRAMGVQLNVTEGERGKYEVLVWEGNVSGKDLHQAGADITDEEMNRDLKASVWMLGEHVIKADTDPWTTLAGELDAPKMFHHFIFEEDESTLLGSGLPNIVRDSQMGMCAGTRMILDNGSVACGINLEINTALLSMNQDLNSHSAFKNYYREDDSPQTINVPAIRAINIDSKIPELQRIVEMFRGFSDQETFVGPATGGDMAKGPSEPFRTAAGASMLRGDAALPFKDVVRNFDMFTMSVIHSIILFNKQFNKDPKLRGDFQPVARGATSLLAKEVLGMQLDQLASTLTPEEKVYIDMHELARARVRVRDLPVEGIVVDNAEGKRREDQKAQQEAQMSETQQRMLEAQIRKLLSDTLKNLSQAGKNNANAEATTANVILNALEKGLSPNALANASTTEGTGAAGPGTPEPAGAGDAGVIGAAGSEAPTDEGQATLAPFGAATAASGGSEGAGFAPVPNQEEAIAA